MPFTSILGSLPSMYTVVPGNYAAFGATDPSYPCQPYLTAFGSCFGNNPSTPYLLLQPPVETPTNSLPPYVQQTFQVGGTSQFYQLGSKEAIVTLLTLPPVSAYFALQTYMLERSSGYYGITNLGTTCTGGTPDPDPVTGLTHTETPDCNFIEFGYFTNTVNNADVVNAGLSEWNTWSNPIGSQAGTPSTYTTIAVITSGNMTLANNLKSLFTSAGLTSFIEQLPASSCSPSSTFACVNTCTGNVVMQNVAPYCDLFGSVIRETLPAYQPNEAAWASLTQPNNYLPNILVYRVTTTATGTLYTPSSVSGLIYKPGCNSNETLVTSPPPPAGCTSGPNFDSDLQWIGTKLASVVGPQAGITYAMPQMSGGAAPGPRCLIYGLNCSGATQDTDSYRTLNLKILEDQIPTFVIGLIHSSSPASVSGSGAAPLNNARYTSIVIGDNQPAAPGFAGQNVGVAAAAEPNFSIEYTPATSQNIPLSGSAAAVLKAFLVYNAAPESVKNDLPNIYIHVFYEYTNGENCTFSQVCGQTQTPTWATIISNGALWQNVLGAQTYFMPASDAVSFTERGYVLSPVSLTAPLASSNLTGATAAFLESPYVLCDSAVACQ